MYRSSLDGLAERVALLEEEKHRLEVDLAGVKRIRGPQLAARLGLGMLLLLATGFVGSALGYRHAAVELQEVTRQDTRVALGRLDVCNARLRTLLADRDDLVEVDLGDGKGQRIRLAEP
jgi:hypothetical protein